MRHDAEEEERGVEAALAAERGEDGVVGYGVADGGEHREEGGRLREGEQAEEMVEARRGLGAAAAEDDGEEGSGAPRGPPGRCRGRDGGGHRDEGAEDARARVLPRHGGRGGRSGAAARPGTEVYFQGKLGCDLRGRGRKN